MDENTDGFDVIHTRGTWAEALKWSRNNYFEEPGEDTDDAPDLGPHTATLLLALREAFAKHSDSDVVQATVAAGGSQLDGWSPRMFQELSAGFQVYLAKGWEQVGRDHIAEEWRGFPEEWVKDFGAVGRATARADEVFVERAAEDGGGLFVFSTFTAAAARAGK